MTMEELRQAPDAGLGPRRSEMEDVTTLDPDGSDLLTGEPDLPQDDTQDNTSLDSRDGGDPGVEDLSPLPDTGQTTSDRATGVTALPD